MQCGICGAEQPEAVKFCGKCGAKIEPAVVKAVPDSLATASSAPMLSMAGHTWTSSWFDRVKVALLLVALTGLLMWVGGLFGGINGVVIAFIGALALNFFSYWFSDKMVMRMTGARPVTPEEAPQLHEIVTELAARAGLPMPTVCLVDDPSPNAFATGRDPQHSVMAVTTGMLSVVDRDQLEAIIGHELAHIKHGDMLLSAIVAALASAIMFLGFLARWGISIFSDDERGNLIGFLVLGILAPLGALLVQLGISRAREYQADEDGAYISGKPLALASALETMEKTVRMQPLQISPSASHLFIVPPSFDGWFANLFSTHPRTAYRVARLKKLVGESAEV